MKSGLVAALAAGVVIACASTRDPQVRDWLPPEALAAPDRMIVVAVANEPPGIAARAGSTPGPYAGPAGYAITGTARSQAAALAADYSLRTVAAWPIARLHLYCVVFEATAAENLAELLARLAKDARVKLAQPLEQFQTSSAAYNDPYLSLQRGFETIDAVEAHQWSRGAGVRVAVIDTGVDLGHPDLRGRIAVARNFVDTDMVRFSRDRHGTEMAGIIAAQANNHIGIVGVAPDVRLIVVKACWETDVNSDQARCNSFTLAKALAAAEDLHADVVNLSLVGPPDPLLTLLIEHASHAGIIFVGAVGPDGGTARFPVRTTGVIPVAMAGDPGNAAPDALRAPGSDILTLTSQGHYTFVSGTSVAVAHVTGVVALLRARDHELTALRAISLLAHADPSVSAVSRDHRSINACLALATLLAQTGCGTVQPASAPVGPNDERAERMSHELNR
jgi:subtilisin family serine protease